jgi:NitT/TauT family transport system substrate-binding protein
MTAWRMARVGGAALALIMTLSIPAAAQDQSVPAAAPGEPISVAFPGSFGVGDVALLAAIDDLRSQGYTIETPQLEDPSLIAQGVSQNQFQLTSGDTPAALRAILAGANLKVIGEKLGDEWQMVAASDIQSCEDLAGRSVGVFAVGSFNDAIVRYYIGANCPGTEVNMLALGDSVARAAAMLAGNLDSSPLEVGDTVPLLAEAGDRFHILTTFAESLPDLRPAAIVANSEWLAENRPAAEALLTALILQNRRIASEDGYLKSLVEKYVPSATPETIDAVVQTFRDAGLYDVNGGMTEDNLNYTIQFFVGAGALQPGLTVEDAADLSILNDVLDELGRE